MKEEKEGWGFPANSRKAHYFDKDSRSLCGKWLFFGELEEGNDDSTDNCTACKKALQKIRTKQILQKLKKGKKIHI